MILARLVQGQLEGGGPEPMHLLWLSGQLSPVPRRPEFISRENPEPGSLAFLIGWS